MYEMSCISSTPQNLTVMMKTIMQVYGLSVLWSLRESKKSSVSKKEEDFEIEIYRILIINLTEKSTEV